MAPNARRHTHDDPQPQTSRRHKDSLYQSSSGNIAPSAESDKSIQKFLTSTVPFAYTGDKLLWPAFEESLVTFLRGFGIPHVITPGYPTSAHFNPLHNQALHKYLLSCVRSTPTVLAVFRRAPSGDGYTAYCHLSEHYGMRDAAHLKAQLMFFAPTDNEQPLAVALRLGDLYAALELAEVYTDQYEMVAKVLSFLEDFPSSDYGGVYSRIEEASTTRGITFEEAISWISKRQQILFDRQALQEVVPRTRPVYKSAVVDPTTDDNGTGSTTVNVAATHRDQPTDKHRPDKRSPREPCTQTPGLFLKRESQECRVNDCKTPTRSRLCEEHALQLISKKAKSLPCSTPKYVGKELKHAYYAVQPAQGSKPEYRGILIRSAADEKIANPT